MNPQHPAGYEIRISDENIGWKRKKKRNMYESNLQKKCSEMLKKSHFTLHATLYTPDSHCPLHT